MAYGTAFSAWWQSPSDGLRYRVTFDRIGWTGSDTHVRLFFYDDSRVVEGSGVGAAAALAALMPAILRVEIEDTGRGMFSAFAGAAPKEWRARVFRDTDESGDGTDPDDYEDPLFLGYLIPEGVREVPFAEPPRVQLAFADGLRILEGMALDEDYFGTHEGALKYLLSILFTLGGGEEDVGLDLWTMPEGSWNGLRLANDWRPYLDDGVEIQAAVDPLSVVQVPKRAFVSADGSVDDQMRVVAQIAARFGLRFVQSAGWLWLIQRDLLARLAVSLPTTVAVPVWSYSREGADTGSPTSTTMLRDCRLTAGWHYGAPGGNQNPGRALPVAVRSAQSTYEFERFDLLINRSFDEQGNPDGTTDGSASTDPRYWQFEGTGAHERFDLDGALSDLDFPGATGPVWGVRLAGSANPNSVVQGRWVRIPGGPDWRYTITWQAAYDSGFTGGGSTLQGPQLELVEADGTVLWGMNGARITITHAAYPKADARLYVESVLSGVSGAETGVEVMPVGAVLALYRVTGSAGPEGYFGEITLTRPLAVGDTVISGDLTLKPAPDGTGDWENVEAGDEIEVYYWDTTAGAIAGGIDTIVDGQLFTGRAEVSGVSISGEVVSGWLRVALRSAIGGTSMNYYDEASLTVQGQGSEDQAFTFVAKMPPGTAGAEVVLPIGADTHTTGDGPVPGSATRLIASSTVGGTTKDTQRGQGDFTSWKTGVHSGAPTEETTIDALATEVALRQVGGLVEQWEGWLYPTSSTHVIYPHEVLLVEQATTLMYPVVAGATTIYTWHKPEVGYPVRISAKREWSGAEVIDVDDAVPFVAAGLGSGWEVTLSDPIAANYPAGAGIVYALMVWPDAFSHDPLTTGAYHVRGTRLRWDSDTEYVEEIRLGN